MEPGYDKYYCDATIDDEFKPGEVYVCLKNEVSYPNKKWPLSTFACVDPVSAVHTNYYDDPEVIARTNLETYTQIFKLELEEKTKEAVLKAIRDLEKMNIVYWAQPIYTSPNTIPEVESASVSESIAISIKRSADATDSGYRSNDSFLQSLDNPFFHCVF